MGESIITVKSYIKYTYVAILSGNVEPHLWFMYPLMGMLLSAPFLAKMFNAMSDEEIHIVFGVALLWNIISIYFSENLGVSFAYSGWILAEWVISFFAGYYCERVINRKNKKILYICGGIGFVINVLGSWKFPGHNNNSTDLAVAFVLFTMAGYVFLKQEIRIKNKIVAKIILFMARYSYGVYVFHWNVLHYITSQIVKIERASIYFCVAVGITLIISLIITFFIDTFFIMPIEKALRKKFVKQY